MKNLKEKLVMKKYRRVGKMRKFYIEDDPYAIAFYGLLNLMYDRITAEVTENTKAIVDYE